MNYVVNYNKVAKRMDHYDISLEFHEVIKRECILGILGIIKSHYES